MTKTNAVTAALAAVALGAAAMPSLSRAQQAHVPIEDHCGASGLQGLLGQTGDIAYLLRMNVETRLLPPGTPMTRDLRYDRLNIAIDEFNVITRVWCG